jgi:hypothetical protein
LSPLLSNRPPNSHNMPWHAKPGCAEHHRAAVKRIVNALPPPWLQPPQTSELFDSLEHCNRRLRGYALAEGFDIVNKGGGTRVNPSWRFRCLFYGEKTRNDRKLEPRVKRGQDGIISSKRQRENTNIRQLRCE